MISENDFLETLGENPSQQLNNNAQGPKLPNGNVGAAPPDTVHTGAAPGNLGSLLLPAGRKTAKRSLPVSSGGPAETRPERSRSPP